MTDPPIFSSMNHVYQSAVSDEDDFEEDPHVVYAEGSRHLLSPSDRLGDVIGDTYERSLQIRGGKVVYACFLLLGMGTLLPWNFFITAESFWQYKFRNTTESSDSWGERETPLQKLYDPMQVCLSQVVTFGFLFINALLSHVVGQKIRIIGCLTVMTILFAITSALAQINTDAWQLVFFIIIMVIIVFVSASGALYQGGLLGMAGNFPPEFMNALLVGQALGGVFAAVSRVVSVYFGVNDVTSAFIYFLIAVGVLASTLVTYVFVSTTVFFKHYSNPSRSLEEDEFKGRYDSQSYREVLREHWKTFTKIWPLGLSVCLVFFITLSIYPVICVAVTSTSSNIIWAEKYFQPVATFLLFNVADYLGRTLAQFVLWPGPNSRVLYVIPVLRVVFVPLFLLCSHNPESPVPSVFTHDAWYIAFMTLFGVSNGYSCALLMMYAPSVVSEREGEKAGYLMGIMMGLGLLTGSLCSFAFNFIS